MLMPQCRQDADASASMAWHRTRRIDPLALLGVRGLMVLTQRVHAAVRVHEQRTRVADVNDGDVVSMCRVDRYWTHQREDARRASTAISYHTEPHARTQNARMHARTHTRMHAQVCACVPFVACVHACVCGACVRACMLARDARRASHSVGLFYEARQVLIVGHHGSLDLLVG